MKIANLRHKITAVLSVTMESVLVLGAVLTATAHALDGTIYNPNLSEASNGQPVGWHTDSWGTNTPTFNYLTTGQNDTSSVEVQMANYSDGDAKWVFDPVSVTAGQTYVFSDYYRSDVTTNLWAQYADSTGAVSYVWLGALAPASDWTQASVTLAVPAGKVAVSIFHVINANGYLDTDTFSLAAQVTPPCNPSESSGIYNGSFAESCDGGQTPASWAHAIYGTNSATFSYLNTGYDDNRSVQTTITNYTSGEAGWYSLPQAAAANQRYHFTGHLQSNTYSYAYVEVQLTDGSYTYLSLMSVPATGGEWSTYDDIFVTPANTSTISIHFAISSLGSLTIDDFQLLPMTNYANNNLAAPLVSINFDDGDASAYKLALPVLNQLGIKATFYINGGTVGTSGHMTAAQIRTIYNQGNEIGSHSYYHDDLVTLTPSDLTAEITNNQTKLANITGHAPTTFATPYGSYNSRVLDTITSTVPYVRDTDNAINHKYNFNPRTIHAKDVTKSMTVADITNLVNQTRQQGGWLVLVYHNIASGGDEYTITQSKFKQELLAIQQTGTAMVPNAAAIAQIQPQL